MAVERNLAGIERDQPDHHIKGGGFAGAVRTQQSDNLAAFDFQGNILNDRACAKAFLQMTRRSALWRTDTGYADGAPLEHFSVIFPVSLLRFRHSGSLRGRIYRAARDGTCSVRIDPSSLRGRLHRFAMEACSARIELHTVFYASFSSSARWQATYRCATLRSSGVSLRQRSTAYGQR